MEAMNKHQYRSIDNIPPFTLHLTLYNGKTVDVEILSYYHQDGSFNREDSQDDYEGYTDIDFTHDGDLSEYEKKDLDKRIRQFIERLYATQDVEFDV